jgi:hypothetical protein
MEFLRSLQNRALRRLAQSEALHFLMQGERSAALCAGHFL